MRRRIQIRLLMLLTIPLIGLATASTATGQTTDSAATSPQIQVASDCSSFADCRSKLQVALERLDKTLDAYEKATVALNASSAEVAERIRLNALKDELIAVKDMIIAAQDELIKRLQKKDTGVWAKVKRILSIAEKAALIAVGIYVGRGL